MNFKHISTFIYDRSAKTKTQQDFTYISSSGKGEVYALKSFVNYLATSHVKVSVMTMTKRNNIKTLKLHAKLNFVPKTEFEVVASVCAQM